MINSREVGGGVAKIQIQCFLTNQNKIVNFYKFLSIGENRHPD